MCYTIKPNGHKQIISHLFKNKINPIYNQYTSISARLWLVEYQNDINLCYREVVVQPFTKNGRRFHPNVVE